jgi:hypothetical protein
MPRGRRQTCRPPGLAEEVQWADMGYQREPKIFAVLLSTVLKKLRLGVRGPLVGCSSVPVARSARVTEFYEKKVFTWIWILTA